jgi:hypothetical protein
VKATYEGKDMKHVSEFDVVIDYVMVVLTWVFMAIYLLLMINEYFSVFSSSLGNVKPLSYLFGEAQWTIHVMFFLILVYQVYHFFQKRK